ncbi:MAG: amino acid ABC transporter ATP-binding protein [Firmicutes bacterium]|nr:amino acid ABC transporter ATP-binding protein [Bacillota bacterium]
MIRIEHLKKEYPNVTPLKDVSVEINDGDVISIIGPSGTGKSTLLRCINQLEKPTSGKIFVDGLEITDPKCDINKVRRKMGMVFQSFNLFGHKTIIENIMLAPMDLLGKSKQEAYDTGMKLLRTVGLAEKALNYPDELSGGQKQRIAIARTLAMDPDVILLDEPTSALDPTMVGEVQAVIRDLAKTGKTMMIVTHEMNFAKAISNRVFYMENGGIYEDGSPEQIFDNPKRENTRRFVRRLKVLELNIESRDYDFIGMQGQIEVWCAKNQISPNYSNRIQLVFEETTNLLIPLLKTPKVQAVCEYSSETELARWTFSYAGEKVDITKTEDEISLSVIKGLAGSIDYEWAENEELQNCLKLNIRSEGIVS